MISNESIFIVGANGQLGTALRNQYPGAQTADIDQLDITDSSSVANFNWTKISVILNAAAYTNVDGAETTEGRIAAWKVNASAVANLAKTAQKNDITVVHISTDYVFDGTRDQHTEDEQFSPISVYGESKAAGDIAIGMIPKHYILRTSWVIGEGKNFVRTMLDVGKRGIDPTVVSDQVGRLTFTTELVRAIDHLLQNNAAYGTYNVSNSGKAASWSEITRAIYSAADLPNTVSDTTTQKYFEGKENIAPRPLLSTLDLSKIQSVGFISTDWEKELHTYVQKELAT